jgi:hypothetical protein
LRIVGIDFESLYNSTSDAPAPCLRFSSCYAPSIEDCRFRNLAAQAIVLRGCFQSSVFRCFFHNLPNTAARETATARQFGYGVEDSASDGTKVDGCSGVNLRHLYTTSTEPSEATETALADFWKHGRTRNALVSNCTAHGCSNSGFDTHEEASDVQFINCFASGSYQGDRSAGAGFSARGFGIAFSACKAVRCRVGFDVGTVAGCDISDCQALLCTREALLINSSDSRSPDFIMRGIRIRSCVLESDATSADQVLLALPSVTVPDTGPFYYDVGVEMEISDTTLRMFGGTADAANKYVARFQHAVALTLDNCKVDVSGLGYRLTARYIDFSTSTASGRTLDLNLQSVVANRLLFYHGASGLAVPSALMGASTAQTFPLELYDMRWESRGNFRPTPTGLVANLSSARMRAYTAIYWNPGRLVDYGNARTAADIINVFGPTSNRPGSLDDTLYLSLTDRDGSVSSAATVGNGSRQGQHLQIRNESPDADVYTFLAYGVSLVLRPCIRLRSRGMARL